LIAAAIMASWPADSLAQQPRTGLPRGGTEALPSGPPGFLTVPGITREEIDAITDVKARRTRLVFANERSSELFRTVDGRLGGAVPLMCEWLTAFFGIRVEPRIVTWDRVLMGLEDGTVDFTGEMTPTPERMKSYFFTSPIAERPVQYMRLPGSRPLREIARTRPVRYVAFRNSVNFPMARHAVEGPYVAHYKGNISDAWEALATGECDAVVVESPVRATFDTFGEVKAEDILPLVTSPVSLAARDPELAPFISAVQRHIDSAGSEAFSGIYRRGARDYGRTRFLLSLDREELEWAVTRTGAATRPILVAFEFDNYPLSFWNEREREFQGIAVDILREIRELTGLDIRNALDGPVTWAQLLDEFERGTVDVAGVFNRTPEREGRFLWTDEPYDEGRLGLVSLSSMRDVAASDVPGLRVGLAEGTAQAEAFRRLFPGHRHEVTFVDSLGPYGALERGEVDLVMGSENDLLAMTNYLERTGFRTNLRLGVPSQSYFGVTRGQPELRSVLSKAQRLVDTDVIVSRWKTRVFDYRGALARERMPLMAAGLALLAMAMGLLAVMIARSRKAARVLEEAVEARTAELVRQTEVAERANRAKSDFLARTSHGIRTPMNAIMGFSELALRECGTPRSLEYIRGIRTAGSGLLAVINDILDFSKIESGSLRLAPSPYLLRPLVNDALTLVRPQLEGKGVMLDAGLAPDLPRELTGDSARVRQALMNLLSNAARFTDRGHVRLAVASERISDCAARVTFEVEDTGRGIRPGDLERLFGESPLDGSPGGTGGRGSGLGLVIARSLCRAMGGDVAAESVFGRGSTFRAWIVQEVADWAPAGDPAGGEPDGAGLPHGTSFVAPAASVLVVDDYGSNLMVAGGLLAPYGMSLAFASGGRESVELAGRTRFDLILMDHMMPVMDGIEALKAIRASGLGSNVPVVALTANAVAGMREMYLACGFDDYLSKPIEPAQLDRLLVKWIPMSKRLAPAELLDSVSPADGIPGSEGALQVSGHGGWEVPVGTAGPAGPFGRRVSVPEGQDGSGNREAPVGPAGLDGSGGREASVGPKGPDVSGGREAQVGMASQDCSGAPQAEGKPALPVLEGVNTALAASRAGGAAKYLMLLEAFRKDAEGSFAALRGNGRDVPDGPLHIAVHALKSACDNIGAAELSCKAAVLEASFREGDMAGVLRDLPSFAERLERLVADIRKFFRPAAGRGGAPREAVGAGSRAVRAGSGQEGTANVAGEGPGPGATARASGNGSGTAGTDLAAGDASGEAGTANAPGDGPGPEGTARATGGGPEPERVPWTESRDAGHGPWSGLRRNQESGRDKLKGIVAGLFGALEANDVRKTDLELSRLQAVAIGSDMEGAVETISDDILTGDHARALVALAEMEARIAPKP
jgi:signal transduction histidine kinase/CheY-like chemotaxis protein